ncbi:hypothetical protein [Micromonospora sp. NPDC003241]
MSAPSPEPSAIPQVVVDADLVDTLIGRGGYTHPLFQRVDGDADGPPLPGQAVVLLLGGLVEQSGLLDDAIALLELRRARFHRMVKAGTTLRVRIERVASRVTSRGTYVVDFRWTGIDADDEPVAEVEAVMLMNGAGREDTT